MICCHFLLLYSKSYSPLKQKICILLTFDRWDIYLIHWKFDFKAGADSSEVHYAINQMDGYMTSKAFTYSLHAVRWLSLGIVAVLGTGYTKEKVVPFSKFVLEWINHLWLDLRPPPQEGKHAWYYKLVKSLWLGGLEPYGRIYYQYFAKWTCSQNDI